MAAKKARSFLRSGSSGRARKRRGLGQLAFLLRIQRLIMNPARFLQRAKAALDHISGRGLWSFCDDYLNRMYRVSDGVQKYKQWIVRNEPPQVWEAQRLIRLKKEPLISIIVPAPREFGRDVDSDDPFCDRSDLLLLSFVLPKGSCKWAHICKSLLRICHRPTDQDSLSFRESRDFREF